MVYTISNSDFKKVSNVFGTNNVRIAKGGKSIIILPVNDLINDNNRGTVQYNLYIDGNGFYWRRKVEGMFGAQHYQLFRYAKGMKTSSDGWRYMGPDGYYVWEHFATVEAAIARFTLYASRQNICA